MAIDYIWEGENAKPTVPYSPATGLDNANNIFYVSSRARAGVPGAWIPVGGQDILLQTNGVDNARQDVENLVAGTNITLVTNGVGGTTIALNSAFSSLILVADGVTDNYPAIAAAIAALPNTGGTINLAAGPPSGTGYCYVSNTVVVAKNGVNIIGSSGPITTGIYGIILQFAAGCAGIIVNGVSLPHAGSCVIANLCLLSEDTGAVSGDNGIWFKGDAGSPTVRNVSVQHFGGNGILIDSTGGGNINQWRIDQCFIYNNFGDGLQNTGGTDGNAGLATALNCTGNQGWGINLDSGADNNAFILPQMTGNVAGGIRVNSAHSNTFYACYFESGIGSSMLCTALSDNNLFYFKNGGQPATFTPTSSTNVVYYHQNSAWGISSPLCIQSSTNFVSGQTWFMTNQSDEWTLGTTDTTQGQNGTILFYNTSDGGIFDYASFLGLVNPVAATVSVSQNSPAIFLQGSYWTGSVSAGDSWRIGSTILSGTNGTSVLEITRTGSPNAYVEFSNPVQCDAGVIVGGATPTVIAGQVGIGNTSASTATAGSAVLPSAPATFLEINVYGTMYKIPLYNV